MWKEYRRIGISRRGDISSDEVTKFEDIRSAEKILMKIQDKLYSCWINERVILDELNVLEMNEGFQ